MNSSHWPSDKILRKINYGLASVVVLVAGYIVIAPFWPQVTYQIAVHVTKPVKLVPSNPQSIRTVDRSYNHLIMPSLQYDTRVVQGTSPDAVNLGPWLRPNTSTPDKGSNTVIAGHRFSYAGRSSLYNLDKLKIGADIYLVYNTRIYHYKVDDYQVVPPTDVTVEGPSASSKLTIYTCTPLWSVKDRLVYESHLMETL